MTLIIFAVAVATIYIIAFLVADYRALNRQAREEQAKKFEDRPVDELWAAQNEIVDFYEANRWTMDLDELEAQLAQKRMIIKILKTV